MTKIRQRQWAQAADGELDEIVVQVFDDLAGEETALRRAHSASARPGQAQGNARRESEQPSSRSRTETVPRYDVGRRPAQGDAWKSRSDDPAPRDRASDDFDVERLFADEPLHEENAEAFTAEEGKYIEDVAAWLAKRPNADLLLDLLAETLWRASVATRADAGGESEQAQGPAPSAATLEDKPASEGN